MSGLIALLDDVAGIAKVAAASVDDVAGMAMKSSAKAAGAVIDDAAVTPKYVHGFDPDRELPIIWKIAKGSIFNKLVILLPVALLLSAFAPWAISPLLMLGGAYLCFEGAEKVWHVFFPHQPHADGHLSAEGDPARLEESKVKGAIKTDFILSAEIMTIILKEATGLIDAMNLSGAARLATEAATLAVAGLVITAAVYGAVALIVKMDDIGVSMASRGGALAGFGRGLVKAMPVVMKTLTIVGTAAMLWVGGNIVIHGLHELGQHQPYDWIHHMAAAAADAAGRATGFVQWAVTAFFDGLFGLALGLALIPLATWVIDPAIRAIRGETAPH